MSDLVETYRGVEIIEQKVSIPSGVKPLLRVEYTCTVAGRTIRDRSIYRVKKIIDKRLDEPEA